METFKAAIFGLICFAIGFYLGVRAADANVQKQLTRETYNPRLEPWYSLQRPGGDWRGWKGQPLPMRADECPGRTRVYCWMDLGPQFCREFCE